MHVTFFQTNFNFDSMPTFSTQTNMPLYKCQPCISIWGDLTFKILWSKLPCLKYHNANTHSLNLSCSYLQFDQRYHTYWASNATFQNSKSKSSIATTNLTSFTKTTSIVPKKKNLPTWIWKQTNEITLGKTTCFKNTDLAKHTLVETHPCKGILKSSQQMVKA